MEEVPNLKQVIKVQPEELKPATQPGVIINQETET